MPLTTGRYGDTTGGRPWFWVRHNLGQLFTRRRDPSDNGGGFSMYREFGAWVLRPERGVRSLRWITPPAHLTRSVPGNDRDAALDWYAAKLGV